MVHPLGGSSRPDPVVSTARVVEVASVAESAGFPREGLGVVIPER